MPETRLAHFDHHWEAELARGYLDDAGVPSRLVSDNLAGGYTFVGNMSGAALLVAAEHLDEARSVLVAAGVLAPAPEEREALLAGDLPGHAPAAHLALSPLQEADRGDLAERLAAARKAEVRHFIRCMLGVTPAAAIPVVGLALEGNVALLALLCVLVTFVEGWRWIRAGRLARRLETELASLQEADRGGNGEEAEA